MAFFSVWTVERSRYLRFSEAAGAARVLASLRQQTIQIGVIRVSTDDVRPVATRNPAPLPTGQPLSALRK